MKNACMHKLSQLEDDPNFPSSYQRGLVTSNMATSSVHNLVQLNFFVHSPLLLLSSQQSLADFPVGRLP